MKRRRRRRGIALMMVVVYTALVLSAWGVANRQAADLLRLQVGLGSGFVALRDLDAQADAGPAAARLASLARGLALLGGTPPAGLPVGIPAAVGDARGAWAFVLEFTRTGPSSWSVAAVPLADWQDDADGRRAAMGLGLGLLDGTPPFDEANAAATHAFKLDVDTGAGTEPFAVEFAAIASGGETAWTVAAYSEQEWADFGKQPGWDDLQPPGGGATP